MTERFVVPEPSDAGKGAYENERGRAGISYSEMNGLRALLATDLPAIVRVEVAAALMATNKNWDWARSIRLPEGNLFPCDTDYLTARYGAAPDNERSPSPDNDSREALRTPTFTREAEAAWTLFCKWWVTKGPDTDRLIDKAQDAVRLYLASREGR